MNTKTLMTNFYQVLGFFFFFFNFSPDTFPLGFSFSEGQVKLLKGLLGT